MTANFGDPPRESTRTEARFEDEPGAERSLHQDALHATHAGVWEWNVQTGETRFDERWAEIVGWTLAELEPVSIDTWLRLAHPDDLPGSAAALERVFARELDRYDYEARMKHRDGHWVWVHDRGRVVEWDADGKPLRMTGTHTEITERKLREQRLRESEALYHAIFEKSGAIKLLLDPADGRLVDVNPAACRFYGYTREQMQGMSVSDLNTRGSEALRDAMQDALAERENFFEFQHRLANGEIRDVEIYSSPVRIGGRELLNSIVHDITERRRAEAARLALERQLQQSSKAESLALMAGAVAHRFNNQLQAVLGNLELTRLAIDSGAGAGAGERLDEALRATQDAARLCELMLTYLGQKQGRRERIDLTEFCRARLATLRAGVREGVTLEFAEPASSPEVEFDSGQLLTVLAALVANSAESREVAPVRVRIGVGRMAAADVPVEGRFPLDWKPTERAYACLSVSDDGPGVPPEHVEKLFDPFFTTKFTGRGMGLPVVLGHVRTHGGAVLVERAPGGGCTMRLSLPALT